MGMKSLKWERIDTKNLFPHIPSSKTTGDESDEKSRPNFTFFDPLVKIRGGLGRMLSGMIELILYLWYTVDGRPLRGLEDKDKIKLR